MCVFVARLNFCVCECVFCCSWGCFHPVLCVCVWVEKKGGGLEEGVIFIVSLRTFLSFAKFLLK